LHARVGRNSRSRMVDKPARENVRRLGDSKESSTEVDH
jgi:hypothetical protein